MTQTTTDLSIFDTTNVQALSPKVKDQWLTALRSGNYEQAQGTLRGVLDFKPLDAPTFGFCCLGVLCDVSNVGEWDDEGNYVTFVDMENGVLPPSLRTLTGLGRTGLFAENFHCQGENLNGRSYVKADYRVDLTLAGLNDNGFTFAQIADVIDYFL